MNSPLQKAILNTTLSINSPPWRDNAFLAFWSPESQIYGSAHVSTSPNAEGRRARFSVSVKGETKEIIESLEIGTFQSDSIHFDQVNRTVSINANSNNDITATIHYSPYLGIADFTDGIAPSVVKDQPLNHFQQGTTVTGTINIDGISYTVSGGGLNDRTWGHRDESKSFREYVAVVAKFPSSFLTILRLQPTGDQPDCTEGVIITESSTQKFNGLGVTRDASGLFVAGHLKKHNSEDDEVLIQSKQRCASNWVPMGYTRRAPTFSSYAEFHQFELGGEIGYGYVEQAILRTLY